MLRLIMRGAGLLILFFLLVSAGFAKNPATNTDGDPNKSDDTATAISADSAASSDTAKADETVSPDTASTAAPAPGAQNSTKDKSGTNDDYTPAPRFTPMLATTGTIGLFTLETADT